MEEQSKHWVLAFSTYDENEKKALQFILLQKQRQASGSARVVIIEELAVVDLEWQTVGWIALGPGAGQ